MSKLLCTLDFALSLRMLNPLHAWKSDKLEILLHFLRVVSLAAISTAASAVFCRSNKSLFCQLLKSWTPIHVTITASLNVSMKHIPFVLVSLEKQAEEYADGFSTLPQNHHLRRRKRIFVSDAGLHPYFCRPVGNAIMGFVSNVSGSVKRAQDEKLNS